MRVGCVRVLFTLAGHTQLRELGEQLRQIRCESSREKLTDRQAGRQPERVGV